MLHGMCDEPENECAYFAEAVTKSSWLICPRASQRCNQGGSIWSHSRRFETVAAAIERVRSEWTGAIDESRGHSLIGFSLGAIVASALTESSQLDLRRVLLIGAKVSPDPNRLRSGRVERLVLAAGERDMTFGHMRRQTRKLQQAGVSAEFVSLGKVGHWFPADFTPRLERTLQWLHGSDEWLER